jgi:hypothetical protein
MPAPKPRLLFLLMNFESFAKKGDSSVGEPGCGEKATLGAALQRAHCKNNEFTMVGNFACNTSHMRWRSAADNNEYQCKKQPIA